MNRIEESFYTTLRSNVICIAKNTLYCLKTSVEKSHRFSGFFIFWSAKTDPFFWGVGYRFLMKKASVIGFRRKWGRLSVLGENGIGFRIQFFLEIWYTVYSLFFLNFKLGSYCYFLIYLQTECHYKSFYIKPVKNFPQISSSLWGPLKFISFKSFPMLYELWSPRTRWIELKKKISHSIAKFFSLKLISGFCLDKIHFRKIPQKTLKATQW